MPFTLLQSGLGNRELAINALPALFLADIRAGVVRREVGDDRANPRIRNCPTEPRQDRRSAPETPL
jgi:hypothetical protein